MEQFRLYIQRIRLAKHAGMKVMEIVQKNIRPRDIMTKKHFKCINSRYGTWMFYQTMLHLPAIAHEAGVDFESWILRMKSVQKHQTFVILHQQVTTYMEDLNEAGGVYAVMNELE